MRARFFLIAVVVSCGSDNKGTGASAKGVSFGDCIKRNSTPAAVRSCDEARPCRDDYVCARSASGTGACMPPYFLFQLRVDGHP